MKEKDILVDFEPHQLVLYAEKNDDTIGPVQTGSYITKNHFGDFLEILGGLEGELVEKLKKGEISPVYFYMMMEELTLPELSARAGIPRRKVRKHLSPEHFNMASVSDLKKYAEVFNIPVANFFQLVTTLQDVKWKMCYREEAEYIQDHIISQIDTENPLVVLTKIEKTR